MLQADRRTGGQEIRNTEIQNRSEAELGGAKYEKPRAKSQEPKAKKTDNRQPITNNFFYSNKYSTK